MITPARPVELVVLALGQLARKAGVASAAGRPWPVDVLLERAASYVESARWPPGQEPQRPGVAKTRAAEWHDGEVPPIRTRAAACVEGGLALLAALG